MRMGRSRFKKSGGEKKHLASSNTVSAYEEDEQKAVAEDRARQTRKKNRRVPEDFVPIDGSLAS